APTQELAASLSGLGPPRIFRPYHNTRFRPGPPLKEHIAASLGEGAALYYFHLSRDGLVIGAGQWHPESDQLERFRAAIDDRRKAAAFERAVRSAAAAGMTLADPELKRAPKGYSPEHPRIDRLRLRRLVVRQHHPLRRWLHTTACDRRIREELESARPFV